MGKQLLKRVLPMLLAIAMLATSVPVNTLAAESQGPVTEFGSESNGEEVLAAATDQVEPVVQWSVIPGAISGITVDDKVIVAECDAIDTDANVFARVLDYIKRTDAGTIASNGTGLRLKVNGVEDNSLKTSLSYAWDGLEAGKVPYLPGDYKLKVSMDPEVASMDDLVIDFRIKKPELKVVAEKASESYSAGTKVSAIKADAVSLFTLKKGISEAGPYAVVVEEPVIKVKETYPKSTELADTDELLSGHDYRITAEYPVKSEYADKVDIAQHADGVVVNVELNTITLKVEGVGIQPGMPVEFDYTGSKISDLIKDNKVKYTVTYKDAENKDVDITSEYTKPEIMWLDANGEKLDGDGKAAPTVAGSYKYQITLKATDKYEEVAGTVDVKINPVKVTITPKVAGSAFKGSEVSDVLAKVTYELNGPKNFKPGENFWGVTYNNPEKPQYYQPVFKLQIGKKASGDKEFTWTDLDETDRIYEVSGVSAVTKIETAYRVVFAGKKAYYTDGVKGDEVSVDRVDVNSSELNYKVDTTVKNYADLTVVDTANASISASEIMKLLDNKGADINNRYVKVYDHKALFTDRTQYKKAQLYVSENGIQKLVKTNISDFTYTWQKVVGVDQAEDKEGNPIYNGEGKPVYDEETIVTENIYDTEFTKLPKDAGMYRIAISYNDKTGQYNVKDAYVYIEIEKQLVKVTATFDGDLSAYENTNVSDFIDNVKNSAKYNFYLLKDNKLDYEVTEADNVTSRFMTYDANYKKYSYGDTLVDPSLYVQRCDNADEKAEGAKYYDCDVDGVDGIFEYGIPYRVGAKVEFADVNYYPVDEDYCYNMLYVNYDNGADGRVVRHINDKDVTTYLSNFTKLDVKKMGTKELNITVDASKIKTYEKTYDGAGIEIPAEAVIVTDAITGEEVKGLELKYNWVIAGPDSYDDPSYVQSNVSPQHAGTYNLLSISYPGGDEYSSASWTNYSPEKLKRFTINKADVIVTLPLEKEVTAGYQGDITELYDFNKAGAITGYIKDDAAAFGNGKLSAAKVFFYDGEKEFKYYVSYSDYLKYNEESTTAVNFESCWNGDVRDVFRYSDELLKDKRSDNYNLVIKNNKIKATKHGRPSVTAYGDLVGISNHYTSVYADKDTKPYTTTVKPVDGVLYYINSDNDKDATGDVIKSGNLFAFTIKMPDEYYDRASDNYDDNLAASSYVNQIKNVGGYVLDTDSYDGEIYVAFPAEKKNAEFTIQWPGEGHTEKFIVDMSKAVLEANFRAAVAPKSLAFNAVNTKMAVGDVQALDVVMTKVQATDVVKLQYAVTEGKDVLSVETLTGIATALKPGKATVSVFPVKLDENGEFVQIAGTKPVVAKIAVDKVSAPSIASVYAYDREVEFDYTVPGNGYRREVYVVEGSKSAAQIETDVKNWENKGKTEFDGIVYFDYASKVNDLGKVTEWTEDVQYAIGEAEVNAKKHTTTAKVFNLKPETKYTLYVRNVSGVRTLDDGSLVTACGVGSAKTFTTTKPQPELLYLSYKDEDMKAAYAEKDSTTKRAKLGYEDYYDDYYVNLANTSKINLSLKGAYTYDWYKTAADEPDSILLDLPLTGNYKNEFCNHNLTYYVFNDVYPTTEPVGENKIKVGDGYYAKTNIAKIDKNGELTVSGVGYVQVVVYDSISKQLCTMDIAIKSNIDAISGKSAKVSVGESVYVYDYLTFKSAGKAVKGTTDGFANSAPVVLSCKDDSVKIDGYQIKAEKPNAKNVEVKVALRDNPAVSTIIKVSTAALKGVSGLKAVDIVDDMADFTFTYKGTPNGDVPRQYRIDLKDARGNLIKSEMRDTDDDYIVDKNYVWQHGGLTDVIYKNVSLSNCSKATYVYRFRIKDNLFKLSSYTVSVSPVYNGMEGKAALAKFKTTNVPYSYRNYTKNDAPNEGKGILVNAGGNYSSSDRIGSVNLKSGNTYAVRVDYDNAFAYACETDKVTWSIQDKSIATVKKLSGVGQAMVVAKKPGRTVIEVKSAITKKVIAKEYVRVKAVGDGNGVFGSNTADNKMINNIKDEGDNKIYAFDPAYNGGIEVITEANPVRFNVDLTGLDYRWISFTAPFEGDYEFESSTAAIQNKYFKGESELSFVYGGSSSYRKISLKAGEKIYIKAVGNAKVATVTVTGSNYVGTLTLGTPMSTENFNQINFTVPADGLYVFGADVPNKSVYAKVGDYGDTYYTANKDNDDDHVEDQIAFTKDDLVKLTSFDDINTISVNSISEPITTSAPVSLGDMANGEEKYYSVKAAKAGWYTIETTPLKADEILSGDSDTAAKLTVYVYANVADCNSDDPDLAIGSLGWDAETKTAKGKVYLDADDEAWVVVKAEDVAENGTVTASIKVSEPEEIPVVKADEAAKKITVAKGAEAWVKFIVPQKNTEYVFTTEAEASDVIVTAKYYENITDEDEAPRVLVNDRGVEIFGDYADTKEIYVKLKTDSTEDSANVNVSVKTTKAAELREGEDGAELTFDKEHQALFTYNPQKTGKYEYKIVVTENTAEGAKTQKLVDNSYISYKDNVSYRNSTGSGSWDSYWSDTKVISHSISSNKLTYTAVVDIARSDLGKKRVFVVTTDTTAENRCNDVTKAKVTIKRIPEVALPVGTEVSVPADTANTYVWTAPADGSYYFSWEAGDNVAVKVGNTAETTVYDNRTVTVTNGQKLSIVVTNRNADAAKTIKFNAPLVAVHKLAKSEEISISEIAAVNNYTYTYPKTGLYKATFEAVGEGVELVVNSGEKAAKVVINDLAGTFGNSKTFTIAAQKDSKSCAAKVKVSIEEVVPEVLKADGTEIKVGKGTQKWFVWEAKEAGRYYTEEYAITGAGSEAKYKSGVAELTDASGLITFSGIPEAYYKLGTKYFIRVKAGAAEDATLKLKITKIVEKEAKVGEKTAATKVTNKVDTYYNFKGIEAGLYQLEVEPKEKFEYSIEEGGSPLEVYYLYDRIYDDWSEYPLSISDGKSEVLRLEEPQDVSIRIFSTVEEVSGVTVKLTKLPEQILSISANEINAKDQETVYGRFTPKKAGYYYFYVDSFPEDVNDEQCYIYAEKPNSMYDIGNMYPDQGYVSWLEINEPVEISTYITTKEGKNKNQKIIINISEIKPTEVNECKEIEFKNSKINYENFVTFKAPENGRYIIEFDGTNVKAKAEKDYYGSSNIANKEEVVLVKGAEMTFSVSYSEAKDDYEGETTPKTADLKLKITKVEPVALKVGENNGGTVKLGESKWYSFTADKTGLYNFGFKYIVDGEEHEGLMGIYAEMFEDITDTVSTDTDYRDEYFRAGEKVYFRVDNDRVDVEVKALVEFSKEIKELTLGQPQNVTIGEEEVEWLVFNSKVDTYYTIEAETTAGVEVRVNSYLVNGERKIFLKKGETFIELRGAKDSVAKVTIDKTNLNSYSPVLIEGHYKRDDIIVEAWDVDSILFTVPESGWYEMSSHFYGNSDDGYSHDPFARLYDAVEWDYEHYIIADDDDSYGTHDFSIIKPLDKGRYYVLESYGLNDRSDGLAARYGIDIIKTLY